jgi:hypothetical protein
MLLSTIYLFGGISTASGIYTVCLLAGFCTGYIAMFLTTVAESYGTNQRNTATTSGTERGARDAYSDDPVFSGL